MKALIQAGGKGTRLQSISGSLPKPMVALCGKPILQWQIEGLVKSGITEIVIVISPTGEVIPAYFKDGSSFGANISYITEPTPLGTGGILYQAKPIIGKEDFILLFGDFDVGYRLEKDDRFSRKSPLRTHGLCPPQQPPL
jgi:Nucleoside-diphosphate-sugar pyrophosphorylase involved in lipopolysaccharide biosynthesis/translation initiation factor 2B, gamma/epsilon subunits (eIF-2Bgamma/eIF-2Bepsilon)